MAHEAMGPSSQQPQGALPARFELIGYSFAVGYLVFLIAAAWQGAWLIDGEGWPKATDFVNVWAAGRLVLDGQPAAVYDWIIHKQAEVAAVGYAFDGYYGWHYPPIFLFAAAALAHLPYVPALLAWLAVTMPAYVAAVRTIIGHRAGYLLACGFPGVVWNISVGQNGFLTAALIGGTLIFIERRPLTAGILLGLLTYKPQFGILFPLALAIDGRWRVIGTAALTALVLAAASWLAFGADSWRAFVEWMPVTSNAVFAEGRAGFDKLQSLLGLVRWLGGSMTLAWALQGALTAACVIAVCLIWRWRISFEIKAAALSAAALLATPYLYIYDFVVLAISMAFIVRIGLRDGFRRYELIGLAIASLLILIFPLQAAPTGLLAVLIVALLIGRRAQAGLLDEAAHAA